jgi:hypothetical protein
VLALRPRDFLWTEMRPVRFFAVWAYPSQRGSRRRLRVTAGDVPPDEPSFVLDFAHGEGVR